MQNMDTIIQVDDLTVQRDIKILDKVNWTVKQGENWAILGPNGSGKTTLVSVLTAYKTLTSGRVQLLGEEYGNYDWRDMRRRIGIISSHVSDKVLPSMTVMELVTSGKYAMLNNWFTVSEYDKKVALKLLESYGVAHLADRRWRALSVGEKQRVMIARAFMNDPKLLILDEPCAGLDPVSRQRFLQYLQDMFSRRSAPGLILITHHIDELIPEITHVMMMKKGKVFAEGTKMDVMSGENLSNLYDASVMLDFNRGRFSAEYVIKNEIIEETVKCL